MKIEKAIRNLESFIRDASKGLPEDVFLLISRLTPLINVDLLIRNRRKQTLFTWRDDGYFPAGWHIPGGIVRYKEMFSERIRAVAATELAAKVKFVSAPLAIQEVIIPSFKNRAHALSFLYECSLISPLPKKLRYKKGSPKQGEWKWHDSCPKDLIQGQRMYRRFL